MSFSVLSDPRQPEVHASTLLVFKGKLLAAWFGGTKEGHADTKIWFSTRDLSQPGSSWTESYPLAAEEGLVHWNPVFLFVPATETILLFYKVGSPISSWYTMIIESKDGETWTKPREMVPGDRGGRGPQKNKPLILSNGTIVAGASIETIDRKWDVYSDWSHDHGKTWERSPLIVINRDTWPGEGANQPSVINYAPGKVTMLIRSSSGFIARADSHDDGKTWGEMYRSPLFNNNSGLDSLLLENGTWLVVHNPVNQNWGPRTPLVISSSKDEGKTWKRVLTLEDKLPPASFSGIVALDTGIVNDGESEFSYPSIISDGKGGAHISYTYERKGIKHVHVEASQLS